MNFITNNNAPDRKKLVKALAEHFDFDATYAGPPTFDYKVGDITVERDGQLATEDEALAARLKDFLIQNEWLDAEVTEAPTTEDEPAPEEPAAEAAPDLEEMVMKVGYPLDGMTVTGLTNLIHLLYSKQYLIGKSVREELIAITDEAISELHEKNPQTVEDSIALIRELTKRGCIKGMAISETDILLAFPLTENDATRAAFQHLGVRHLQRRQGRNEGSGRLPEAGGREVPHARLAPAARFRRPRQRRSPQDPAPAPRRLQRIPERRTSQAPRGQVRRDPQGAARGRTCGGRSPGRSPGPDSGAGGRR